MKGNSKCGVKTIVILIIAVLVFCFIGLTVFNICFYKRIEKNDGFNYKGQHYTYYDEFDSTFCFIPFGSAHCVLYPDLKFKSYFPLKYYKDDEEKLFFYTFSVAGNSIYKKDSYDIPYNPESEAVNYLLVIYDGGDRHCYIKNKNDISEIVMYFNNIHGEHLSDNSGDVRIIAASEKYGGTFELTQEDRSVFKTGDQFHFEIDSKELPAGISNILLSYYSSSVTGDL